MQVKKTIWQPLVIGVVFGLLAGIATVAGLSFLNPGINEYAIGFYVTLFLVSAALGGPLAGAIASTIFVISSTLFGSPDMKAVLGDPITFWSNLLALGATVVLVSFAYRLIFERLKMPARLLAWAIIVIGYYAVSVPSSIVPQYLLQGNAGSEILPAVLDGYGIYFPQAIFDIFLTSLVLIALPSAYTRPLWHAPKTAPIQDGRTSAGQGQIEAAKSETNRTRAHHDS